MWMFIVCYWEKKADEVVKIFGKGQEEYFMLLVLDQLKNGVDSGVGAPGDGASRTPNHFPSPELDVPRIADSLITEVKSGHLAGPFEIGKITGAKINGLMAVVKADGSRR